MVTPACRLLVLLLALGACRWDEPPPAPPVAPVAPVDDSASTSSVDSSIRLFLRIDAGTVLRARDGADAPAAAIVDASGVVPVTESRPPWYAVETPDGRGWIRLEKADAADRIVRIKTISGPRNGRPIDPAARDLARSILGSDARDASCGPYRLLTDVREPALLDVCDRLATAIDRTYADRFGLTPQGQPEATVLLFAERAALRRFATRAGGRGAGYAAYTHASDGYLAMHAQADRDEVLRTLTHEIAHLVHRRAIGDLPRWLSEGLADAIGDSAHAGGFLPLEGVVGAEGQARRLLGAYDIGRAPSLGTLVTKPDAEFDRASVSFDYEASALLVRYLLVHPPYAPRFRAFLATVANGRPASAERLAESLGTDWLTLGAAFERWLRATRS